jgi:O-methyltransferase
MPKLRSVVRAGRYFYREWSEDSKYNEIYARFQSYTMIPRTEFANTLRLAERSKMVEGCVVQCGVWKGGMAAGLVSALGTKREYFLFDSFEGLPKAAEIDGQAALEWQSNTRGPDYHDNCAASPDFAERAMTLSGAEKYRLIKGWFDQTLAQSKPGTPIAFLHLDADWYESTTVCLEELFDLVAAGGFVVLDDYYAWDGCSRALHDFLSRRSAVERIRNLGNVCYVQKGL